MSLSGTYNSISFSGYSYTLLEKTMPVSFAQNDGLYWAYTEEDVVIDEMDTQVKNLVGEEVTVSRYDSNVKNILSTVSSFPIIIQTLLLIFLVISGVIILNSTIMDINNSNKVYGIMKSTGFSNGLITKILVIRTMLMTAVGAIIGFVANLLTMNLVMQGVFEVTPFSSIKLPVIFEAGGSLVLLVIFIVIGIVGTLIPSKKLEGYRQNN
jgi:putative ABC transport system permease protein